MKVEKLEVGQVVKNYKELCSLLDIEVKKGGNSKQSQIKDIGRFIDFERSGFKYIITNIHNVPIQKRKINRRIKYDSILITHPDLIPSIIDCLNNRLDDVSQKSKQVMIWKCESCFEPFKDSVSTITYKNKSTCRKCSKSHGARKVQSLLEKYSIPFDDEITFPDLKVVQHLRFDYGLFKDDKVIALIEYDGGFHDVNGMTQDYDRIKDNYCATNEIPLLRIHHTEAKHMKIKLLSFLYRFYPSLVNKDRLLADSKKIEIENQKLLAKVEANNKLLKDLLEVIK